MNTSSSVDCDNATDNTPRLALFPSKSLNISGKIFGDADSIGKNIDHSYGVVVTVGKSVIFADVTVLCTSSRVSVHLLLSSEIIDSV